ncbi:hypothetical protein Pla100_08030 [Neorhodopirellula pilleata]|uniref:Uncharacterized protein n=1 Tax=Neorhodopirellula pilleata TaxID=2714738 RepID=A0A5C6AW66_9BACT|nr:hypothetical protein Pla100_08030 [Neorhodopirellula pilleata]
MLTTKEFGVLPPHPALTKSASGKSPLAPPTPSKVGFRTLEEIVKILGGKEGTRFGKNNAIGRARPSERRHTFAPFCATTPLRIFLTGAELSE